MFQRATRKLPVLAVLLVTLSLLLSSSASAASRHPKPTLSGSITVSAASSLTQAFEHIAAKFHKMYKHTTVTFNFGSSTTLSSQILAGAPADVYASADLTNMDKLVSASYVRAAPSVFARNEMEIAVKPRNPMHITSLANLATAGTVALCGVTVPCGQYAANILQRAGVTIPATSITREINSQSTVQQVSLGDANAAIVYVTDVNSVGKLATGIKIPLGQNTIADYAIAPLTTSTHGKLAYAFVKFVNSSSGEKSLLNQGFLAP